MTIANCEFPNICISDLYSRFDTIIGFRRIFKSFGNQKQMYYYLPPLPTVTPKVIFIVTIIVRNSAFLSTNMLHCCLIVALFLLLGVCFVGTHCFE